MGRSFGNTWHDAVMGEIELGSFDAYLNLTYPHDNGWSLMQMWRLFEVDDAGEAGREPSNDSPWGPWEATEEDLETDREIAWTHTEFLKDQELERKLRRRP